VAGTSGISGSRMNFLSATETDKLRLWIDQDPSAPETAP